MPNRSPQGDSINQPTEPMPVWTPPQPGSYERRGMDTQHRHDGGGDDFHYQGNLPHYHDPDSGILVFFDPAAKAPNSAATEVDPNPATSGRTEVATPALAMGADAEPVLTGGSGGEAGSGRPKRDRRGRFLAKPATPPMSADLARALFDAEQEVWRVDNTLRTARVLTAAVGFVDGVRHSGGDGAQ